MSKNTDDPERVRWWPFWLILSFVIIFWFLSLLEWFPWWVTNERGQFGDSFGTVNALFAGLAFAGVIFAIILQWQELGLQRQELKDTRAEIKGQKETLQKQNFESSFFQLLTMHSEIVNLLMMEQGGKELSGRECLSLMLKGLRSFSGGSYERFYSNYHQYIGHYFRHLYHIIQFVDRSDQEVEAKNFYIDLIRAQLSSDELGLLFYHGLSDRGTVFKDLVEKYALFTDMSFEVLMNEEHRNLYAPSAYGESE